MKTFRINTNELKEVIPKLSAGDSVLLSGRVYTARDAAHAKLLELIRKGESLPFDIKNAAIYYAGPTEAPEGRPIGSCGPTTASRMDSFSPVLLNMGLCCMIGKGNRSLEVVEATKKNGAVYFCAIGGAGALAAKSITECEVIAFPELGCESIKRLEFKDFPLIVGIDSRGSSVFSR